MAEKIRKLHFVVLILVLILSLFLRFFRLRDYMMFLGDQGRDVLVVERMLIDGKFTLLGPVASVGGFYLGPLYYYLITPVLWIFNFDPVGPAFFVAAITSFVPLLLFFYLKRKFSIATAILACFLYAISPTLVKSGRFSWNPNLVPLFSLLFYMSLEKYLATRKMRYALLTGFLLGCLFQLHYLTFIFVPVALLMLIVTNRDSMVIDTVSRRAEKELHGLTYYVKELFFSFSSMLLGIIIGWLPFIIYEFRHSFQNFAGLAEFIARSGDANVGFDPTRYFKTIYSNFSDIFLHLFNFPNYIVFIIFISFILYFVKRKKSALVKFVILSLLVLSFYKGKMGEHYFNILYIFFLIIFADIFSFLFQKKYFIFGILGALLLLRFAVPAYPFWEQPNRQLDQTIEISKYILAKYVDKKPFNFALVTSTNSDYAYRYFFDLGGNLPKEILNDVIDPKRESVTDKLIVLCEPLAPCVDPRGHPLWEIAAFGRAEIVHKEEHGVYTIYEMKHAEKYRKI